MTRAQARRRYRLSTTRGTRHEDFFCLTPTGVRVGYASPRLLRAVPRSERRQISGRVVWASTASVFYDLDGIRPGASVRAAGRRLRLSRRFQIGLNSWYLAANGESAAVFKVRHGIIEEIGIADLRLTRGRGAELAFLRSFS
jgi:hypothetical protein